MHLPLIGHFKTGFFYNSPDPRNEASSRATTFQQQQTGYQLRPEADRDKSHIYCK